MSLKIYNYNRSTGEYIGQGFADIDPVAFTPKKPAYLIPAHATECAPPAPVSGKKAVFDAATETWSQQEDSRGTVYNTTTGQPEQWDKLGALPSGRTKVTPQPHQSWDAVSSAWVYDLARGIAAQTTVIEDGYNTAMSAITAAYPATERETWSLQEAEARAWMADNTVATPYLTGLAVARAPLTVNDLAVNVIAKADAFKPLAAAAIGRRRVLLDQLAVMALDPATTQAQIEAVVW